MFCFDLPGGVGGWWVGWWFLIGLRMGQSISNIIKKIILGSQCISMFDGYSFHFSLWIMSELIHTLGKIEGLCFLSGY